VAAALAEPGRSLRQRIPEVYDGFNAMSRAATAEGELSTAMKEVIALVIGVAHQCDGCVSAHARKAARRGATPDQVAEALGVAIFMMGGPGTVYAAKAWDAFTEFSEHRSDGSAAQILDG
jgi:AhpD family alkylhydroperoxidase